MPSAPALPAALSDRIEAIESLLGRHQLYTGRYDRLWAVLEAHRINERAPGDGSPVPLGEAGEILAWLLRAERAGTLERWT